MPYKSRAQQGYMHVHHPDIAARWDKNYPVGKKLPRHSRPKRDQRQKLVDQFMSKARHGSAK